MYIDTVKLFEINKIISDVICSKDNKLNINDKDKLLSCIDDINKMIEKTNKSPQLFFPS